MTQSSFPLLFSSSSSPHRLVTLISILLLNPLPIIQGAPTRETNNDELTVHRHKRQLISTNLDDGSLNIANLNENLVAPEPEIVFEGLLGMNMSTRTARKRKTNHLCDNSLRRLPIRSKCM